ncbi:Mannosylglycerate hydrolase [Limihaloglobus sulfuriphilus]|uniref:alpha-mannosidase n=1 Tax=Limihaloglobus sulfuriphilus TaxID=1851148 RepID=A0A1Q2MBM2_9BACT|nr:alpha-mannosidase [Limihaloglobus sulfuriphilus]AQQ69677.1 Mannosylglycerate hydrolase [Limihaloglobus sulfuriphilus]
MLDHKTRFTLEKLTAKLELLKDKCETKAMPLGPVKYIELPDATAEPMIEPDFDDSSWQTLEAPCYWGGWRRNFTMRGVFSIPAGWCGGGCAALSFDFGSEPDLDFCHPEMLVHIDGEPLAAADRFHRLLFIPDKYCDGKEHSLAMSGYTGMLGFKRDENHQKLFMKKMDIIEFNRPAAEFTALSRAALESVRRLPEDSPARSRLLNVLDKSFTKLELSPVHTEGFMPSLEQASKMLNDGIQACGEPMDVDIHAIGHSHIDVAWLWPLAQTRNKCRRSFSTVMALMDEHRDYVFTQSQPQLYQYVLEDSPQLFEKIRQKVKQDRWEPIGGMWVEADCNISGAESLARQFLLGRGFFAEHFGQDADSPILWLPDVFGYSANLPQIIKLAGMEYFFTIKISWNQYNSLPYDSFWWQGIDGTKVLAHLGTTRESSDEREVTYNSMATPNQFYNTWAFCKQKEFHTDLMCCYGYGDGGGGPTREMLENIEHCNNMPGMPRVKHSKAIEFFDRLKEKSSDKLPIWNGELYLEYHRGTYTTQAANKKNNRRSEFGLHDAEFLSSLASVLDSDYKYPADSFTRAWQLVCLNQFHDIIPGSSIAEVYRDSDRDYAEVADIVGETSRAAIDVVCSKSHADILLINPASAARNDAAVIDAAIDDNQHLEDSCGNPVLSQKTENGMLIDCKGLNGFEVRRLSIAGGSLDAENVSVTDRTLENSFVRVCLNDAGDIESIYDKKHCREIIPDGCIANEMLAFEDRPISYDAWDIEIYYQDKVYKAEPAESIRVVEEGPLCSAIEVKRRILASTYTQRISLGANSAQIDISTDIDWREKKTLLKAAFPVDILSPEASYEIQWGHVKRSTHKNTSWDWARFESCAQKWVDLSEDDYGVSLLNDCKYGHDIQDNVIRITLLRGSTMPDADADKGRHTFKYSILPHAGRVGMETVNAGYAVNDPVIAVRNDSAAAVSQDISPLFSVDRESVVIETVKRSEDGTALLLRLYNSLAGRGEFRLTAGFDVKECFKSNIMEENLEKLDVADNAVTLNIKPFEILCLKIS